MHLNLWEHLFAVNIFKLGLRVFHVPDSARDVGHVVEGAIEICERLDGCVDRVLIGLPLSSSILLRNKVWTKSERLCRVIHTSIARSAGCVHLIVASIFDYNFGTCRSGVLLCVQHDVITRLIYS